MDNRSRSSKYQHVIKEIPTDPVYFNDILIEPSEQNNEDLMDLRDKLMIRVVEIARVLLTKRQMEILTLTLEGKTQSEIAELLGIRNQSAVCKALNGNMVYIPTRKRHGGIIKRLRDACAEDYEIEDLLFDVEELDL